MVILGIYQFQLWLTTAASICPTVNEGGELSAAVRSVVHLSIYTWSSESQTKTVYSPCRPIVWQIANENFINVAVFLSWAVRVPDSGHQLHVGVIICWYAGILCIRWSSTHGANVFENRREKRLPPHWTELIVIRTYFTCLCEES